MSESVAAKHTVKLLLTVMMALSDLDLRAEAWFQNLERKDSSDIFDPAAGSYITSGRKHADTSELGATSHSTHNFIVSPVNWFES